ncbi:MAG: hypothetical protein KGY38_02895 [Desulfobacterales bacterium]|nr:hypothetical protein [Desulfobacterales bacterium]
MEKTDLNRFCFNMEKNTYMKAIISGGTCYYYSYYYFYAGGLPGVR